MNKLKIFIFLSSFLSLWLFSSAYADQDQMNDTLTKIADQLQAIKPLIAEAEAEQPPNNRVQFHFTDFIGSDGKEHPGLKEDIDAIQAGVLAALNQNNSAPRTVMPLNDDFIGNNHV